MKQIFFENVTFRDNK